MRKSGCRLTAFLWRPVCRKTYVGIWPLVFSSSGRGALTSIFLEASAYVENRTARVEVRGIAEALDGDNRAGHGSLFRTNDPLMNKD